MATRLLWSDLKKYTFIIVWKVYRVINLSHFPGKYLRIFKKICFAYTRRYMFYYVFQYFQKCLFISFISITTTDCRFFQKGTCAFSSIKMQTQHVSHSKLTNCWKLKIRTLISFKMSCLHIYGIKNSCSHLKNNVHTTFTDKGWRWRKF